MRLHELIDRLPQVNHRLADLPEAEVLGVQDDSRRVSTGDLFVARGGLDFDGAAFVHDAHRRGAVAVVAERILVDSPLPTIVVPRAGEAAGVLANAVLGDPSREVAVSGVTGTNGKTTVTYLLRHLLASAGRRCGLVGTCELDDGVRARPAAMTTPGPIQLAETLAAMRDNGCDAAAVEVSSHALDQRRAAGVRFAAAAFTNLTGDHLDYHETMSNYAESKRRLLRSLDADAVAVVNADDPRAEFMADGCAGRVVTFSLSPRGGEYAAVDVEVTGAGSRFVLIAPTGRAKVRTPLVGRHNVANALCAAALACETYGLSVAAVAAGLADAAGAPGRLERVDGGQPFGVFVDYAHTDDALDNVLRSLRPICRGRLRVVFGCGGDRDRSKRPRMAAAAENRADDVYVTSDNPRTEDPAEIVADVVAGLERPGAAVVEVDRRTAIRRAVGDAGPGDVVLLAGKGHEAYQIVGDRRLSFDDVAEARRAIQDLAGAAVAAVA